MITEALDKIASEIPASVTLVAVSKTKPVAMLQEAYDQGQRIFGENRIQEMAEKHEALPKDIQWHSIGHVQTKKVKYMAPFVAMIHAVDSMKLLVEIDKQAKKYDRTIDCLLQFHIAQEDSKYGMEFQEVQELLETEELISLENISIVGVMGMATFTDDTEQVREEFRTLENYFQIIKSHYFKFNDAFQHISMGMSGDYRIAIEEGSTMIRVGSSIFGERK